LIDIPFNLFEKALEEVVEYMNENFFPSFMKSNDYLFMKANNNLDISKIMKNFI
jgi:heptaprenylglyceryl phosphate synthase